MELNCFDSKLSQSPVSETFIKISSSLIQLHTKKPNFGIVFHSIRCLILHIRTTENWINLNLYSYKYVYIQATMSLYTCQFILHPFMLCIVLLKMSIDWCSSSIEFMSFVCYSLQYKSCRIERNTVTHSKKRVWNWL